MVRFIFALFQGHNLSARRSGTFLIGKAVQAHEYVIFAGNLGGAQPIGQSDRPAVVDREGYVGKASAIRKREGYACFVIRATE